MTALAEHPHGRPVTEPDRSHTSYAPVLVIRSSTGAPPA